MSKYWMVMFVMLIVFVAAGWWFVKGHEEKLLSTAMASEKERVAEYIRGKAVTANLTKEVFDSSDFEVQDAVFKKFWATIQSPEYVRIKVWNDNYTLIWADLKESIGQRFPDNHEMEEALEGEIELEIETLGGTENENERQFFKTSEVYVPMYGPEGKEVIGVVEVYKTAHFIDEAKDGAFRTLIITTVVLLLIYSVFAILLHKLFRGKETSVNA